MGFREKLAVDYFDDLVVYRDRVCKGIGRKKECHPLAGVSAKVESGSDLESRVTLTRLMALGVFALAAKKKTGGEAYLTVEGPDFFWTVEVDRKKRSHAERFAAKVNDLARKMAVSQ